MDYTFPGSRPIAADREDGSYLDFAEGARLFIMSKLQPAARKATQAVMEQAFANPDITPKDIEGIGHVIASAPISATGYRVQRTVQEMIWRTTYDTLYKREAELLAELDAADSMGPGSVEYDPNFKYPDYFTGTEFHLEKGGYADPLGGYIYHLGGNVFHSGLNERWDGNTAIVGNVPLPADGRVGRVLELACSPGLSSIALKERFPEAELWATDIAAPMVRYAHKRAVELGLDIHFKQMAAEEITFPDNHFDLVYVHIMFHELPVEVSRQVMDEVYRVLRPGGVFAASDGVDNSMTAPGSAERALSEYSRYWQALYNGEIYTVDFGQTDLAGLMREAGFRTVIPNHTSNMHAWGPNLALPVRVGEK